MKIKRKEHKFLKDNICIFHLLMIARKSNFKMITRKEYPFIQNEFKQVPLKKVTLELSLKSSKRRFPFKVFKVNVITKDTKEIYLF